MRHWSVHSALVSLLLVALLSCNVGRELAGKYQAVDPQGRGDLLLVLKSDGKGSWMVAREDISLNWERKGEGILLHSKYGGVVVGKLGKDNAIEINLPTVGQLRFERLKE